MSKTVPDTFYFPFSFLKTVPDTFSFPDFSKAQHFFSQEFPDLFRALSMSAPGITQASEHGNAYD
jgi:hypothetical protein